jgi:hypothetical protein
MHEGRTFSIPGPDGGFVAVGGEAPGRSRIPAAGADLYPEAQVDDLRRQRLGSFEAVPSDPE